MEVAGKNVPNDLQAGEKDEREAENPNVALLRTHFPPVLAVGTPIENDVYNLDIPNTRFFCLAYNSIDRSRLHRIIHPWEPAGPETGR
jgi:hypothetical protein